jgi:hypothetical protein
MAADSHEYHKGEMDISEHVKSWKGFTTFVKVSMFGIFLIMLFLAVFRTHG